MGLKKNFFKGLQNGINTSPIKQENGVDKKFPNIVNKVANDNIVNNNFSATIKSNLPSLNSLVDPRTNLNPYKPSEFYNTINLTDNENLNNEYKNIKLKMMIKKYPEANVEDLENYIFSNKTGLKPSEYALTPEGYSYENAQQNFIPWYNSEPINDANMIQSGLIVDDRDGAGSFGGGETYSLQNPKINNSLFGLSQEEKKAHYYDRLNQIDRSTAIGQHEYDSKKKTIDHFTNPIAVQRFLNQGQTSGTNANNSDKPGELATQGDLDMMLNGLFDKKYQASGSGSTLGSVTPGDAKHNFSLKNEFINSPFFDPKEAKYSSRSTTKTPFQGFTSHELTNINPTILEGGHDPRAISDFKENTFKQVGAHENLHLTDMDRFMDPAIRSVLRPSNTRGGRKKDWGMSNPVYNSSPGEMYANFFEFRELMDMEQGEQFDMKSFDKRIKDKKINVGAGNDFLNDFTKESLIEALNTIADADKKTPGKNKFEDLKMMQGNMNTEVA